MPRLRLLVPPDPREAQAVRRRITAFVRGLGVADDVLYDVVTVIGEAFANVVQHARTREAIELTAWLEDDCRLVTRIVDRGQGFTVSAEDLGTNPAQALAECGRGMWIMNRCCDTFAVESIPGLGTAIVFAHNLGDR